mgnify:CR=1 FL=1
MKGRSASKIKLTSYDELLGGGEEINDIQQVSLEHLHSFENHPFQVNDDEAMAELVESVKEEGILTALLVRPLGDGEYEIIAGHRRRHAAQLAGLKEVPVIIRNMDQDTAVRAMVDSNLQRPNILPSEKAFAYRSVILSRTGSEITGFSDFKSFATSSKTKLISLISDRIISIVSFFPTTHT